MRQLVSSPLTPGLVELGDESKSALDQTSKSLARRLLNLCMDDLGAWLIPDISFGLT